MESDMGTTLQDAIGNDDNFIEALKALDKFATKDALGDKADKSALDSKADKSELADKADKSALDGKADKSELADKADKSALDGKADKSELANKADKSALDGKADKSELADKADKSALDDKADKSALSGLVLGKGPSAEAVATQLLSTAKNKDDLGKAILGVTKEVDGTEKPALETDLAGNKTLQDAVAGNETLKKDLAKPAEIANVKALQTAVAADPGLQTAVKNALASDPDFGEGAKTQANKEDPVFQGAVREVMLQPFCKIPEGENEPMCCYDPHPTCLLGA
jgi:hypothetical protein